MSARPLYVGIDLGTTNSAAAVFDGEAVSVVRNAQGGLLTPSVVRIDVRGNVSVGARARRFLDADPAHTRSEFKRLMGTTHVLDFGDAGTRKPEQLAAEVLRSLRSDVKDQSGVEPECAVVSVPALFELPQTAATSEAARLAGFTRVEMIQEPVASALAAGWSAEQSTGAWLVYDLGGGTFDVSLLETQEGLLRVIGHDGDNFLGGRDFDAAIVDWLIERVADQTGVRIDRANPSHAGALRRLGSLAEEAKIDLSRRDQSDLVLAGLQVDGANIDVEATLERGVFERLIGAFVDRSLTICDRLLRTHGLSPSALERVVLVGGPTVIPRLRERVGEALRAPFGEGFDPMTLVAQGAALFAAAAALDARPRERRSPQQDGPRVWLQHPAMTPDLSPFVVGKLLSDAGQVRNVRLRRNDGEWTSEPEALDAEATFSVMVRLLPRRTNEFTVEGIGTDGRIVPLSPSTLTIVHGVAIGEPPLSRSIGVALANNAVQVYVERGAPLPMRRTFRHRTVETVGPELDAYALRIPFVQGEFPWAHLCRLVGSLEIPSRALHATLPAGSEIEVTIELDRGGRLQARARIESLNQVFDQVAQLVVPSLGVDDLAAAVDQARLRVNELRMRAFRDGGGATLKALGDAETVIAEAARAAQAAQGGDADSAEKARRLLVDLNGLIEAQESERAWPELEARVREEQAIALSWLGVHGTDAERSAGSRSVASIDRALSARNPQEVERQLRLLRRLGNAAYFREPDSWSWEFDALAARASEAQDLKRATELVDQGKRACRQGDDKTLQSVVRQLWKLLPGDPEERKLSHQSGVR